MKKQDELLIILLIAGVVAFFMRKQIVNIGINTIEKGKALAAGIPVSLLESMALAIQDWEDGVKDMQLTAGTVAGENNNPGNLRWSGNLDKIPFTGALGVDSRAHIVFETREAGWNALLKQLRISFTGQSSNFNPAMTLYQFFAKYAEANTENYANQVARDIGMDPRMTLTEILANWQS